MKRSIAFLGMSLVVLAFVLGYASLQTHPLNDQPFSSGPAGAPIHPDEGRF